MRLQTLGAEALIRLMACGDRPGFTGPDLSWLLYGPEMEPMRETARPVQSREDISQQKQPSA